MRVENPIEVIKKEITAFQPVDVPGLPRFYGGLVGYIGYDMVRFFEEIPDTNTPGLKLPDMFLMVTDTVVIFDNLTGKIKVVSNAHINNKSPEEAYQEAEEKIGSIIEKLRRSKIPRGQKKAESLRMPCHRFRRSPCRNDEPPGATRLFQDTNHPFSQRIHLKRLS